MLSRINTIMCRRGRRCSCSFNSFCFLWPSARLSLSLSLSLLLLYRFVGLCEK